MNGFETAYARALAGHLVAGGAPDTEITTRLGRDADAARMTVREIVDAHRHARTELLREHGFERLADIDAFLTEALAAFEISRRDDVAARRSALEARQRIELLTGLSDAYLAIAAAPTLDERAAQVCVEAKGFLGAEDARLEFGTRRGQREDRPDEMVAELLGNGGRLILRTHAGRTWSDDDRRTLAQLAVLISAPIDDARRLDFAQRLDTVGTRLAVATTRQELLDGILADDAPGLGAGGDATLWLDGDHIVSRDGRRSPSAEQVRLLATVAADGVSVFLASDAAIVEHLGTGAGDLVDERAWAVVPFGGEAQGPGALGLWFGESQHFDGVQRVFIAQLASRLATALDRVAAADGERVARIEAESASARFRALQELAMELSRAATRRRVAEALLRRASRWSGALGGVVATAGAGRALAPIAHAGVFRQGTDLMDGPVAEALRELRGRGESAGADELSDDVRAQLEGLGVRSLAVFPISAGRRRSVGVMVLAWAEPHAADVLDELLRAQVAMAGPALVRAEQYDIEHDIADTLQRSTLEVPDVDLPGVRWAVHYRAGSAGLAGGDWYDIHALDEHRLAITVGDVVGRGVHAAATMGQLRSATRAIAQLVDGPAAVLHALDEFTASTGQGRYSTIAHLVLDTVTGDLEHAVAGHLPPLLRLPDGTFELVDTGHGPVLGVDCTRRGARRRIPVGSLLLLYTDGLVERRGESLDVGIQRLIAAVGAVGNDVSPRHLCAEVAARLVADEANDDVAIVAVELTG